jgi:hypothetical protein
MAALLFGSLTNSCDSCYDAVMCPCRVCGNAFQKCGEFFQGVGNVICSPFFPYLAITAALNIPPTIWSIQSYTTTCTLSWWLWVNGFLCVAHIVASYYIVHKIQQQFREDKTDDIMELQDQPVSLTKHTDEEKAETSTTRTTTEPASTSEYQSMDAHVSDTNEADTDTLKNSPSRSLCHRLSRVLCYDAGVAIYIMVALLWVVWQTLGMAVIFRAGGDFEDDTCHVKRRIFLSLTCGWLYAMLVSVSFASSFLCVRQIM